ncbi:hypothetical protein DES49_0667 [Halospina denitrificans]|uniref:Uncharacterized protein n=1 Tax=Halospina denitrificans TaxID=332522 RepID=A0A4R7K251_9GAMM|nr:hypothetical protein [Halospina denitrificans]TDT44556.1 hypothetical protein DES49_0667 [Halospina denitrificans]
MQNQLILRRTLNVVCWHVSGQVATAKERRDLIPLLLRAQEVEQTGAKDIAEHLFFESNSRKVVAERLLQVAHSYGLLKKESAGAYSLSEEGKQAIARERVYVPQEGTWIIWASDEPMLDHPILHVEAWSEPSAFDEVWGKEKHKNSERAFEELPRWMTESEGRAFDMVCKTTESRRIDSMQINAEPVRNHAFIYLEWNVNKGKLWLRGELADQSVDSSLNAPDIESNQVWKNLLECVELWPRWDPSQQALRMAFDESSKSERESLTRVLKFKNPEISGAGRFEDLDVYDVPLLPLSGEDAKKWAEWRLEARISDYATNSRYQQWTNEAAEPFAEFSPTLPPRDALAELVWTQRGNRPTAKCWYLMASEDWGL